MKKILSILLSVILICGCLIFTACGEGSDDAAGSSAEADAADEEESTEAPDDGLEYMTFKELKDSGMQYPFMDRINPLDHEYVCFIPEDASGDISVPSEHHEKSVAAVISRSPESDISSLTVGDGVMIIEGFKVTKNLRTLVLPSSLYWIGNSFCESPLGSLDVEAVHSIDIVDSFLRCSALGSVTFKGTTDELFSIKDSFNDSAVESINFTEVSYIERSFNHCTLKTAELTEVGTIADSFNDCPALEKVAVSGDESSKLVIQGSLNDCEKLSAFSCKEEIRNTDGSFEDCPALKDSPRLKRSLTREEYLKANAEYEEEMAKHQKEQEAFDRLYKDTRGLAAQKERFTEIFDTAVEKLAASGAIPEPEKGSFRGYDQYDLAFEKTGDGYAPVFNDLSVRDRLLSEPDFELKDVVLVDRDDKLYWLSAADDDPERIHIQTYDLDTGYHLIGSYATSLDNCRYLICYRGYLTDVEDDYYTHVQGIPGSVGRGTTTTVVYIIDVKTGDIVHIKPVDDAQPGETIIIDEKKEAEMYKDAVYSDLDRSSAVEYIASLLQ